MISLAESFSGFDPIPDLVRTEQMEQDTAEYGVDKLS